MDIISQNSEKEWVVRMTTHNDTSDCELLFVGDIALARRIGDNVDNNTADFPFAKLNKNLFGNDAFIFNLECCLSERGEPWEPKPEFMRGKGEYLGVLKSIPSEKYIANISNNHFLDYGSTGAKDTLTNLEKHDMEYIGAVMNSKIIKPYVMTINGIKIALLAFSPSAHALDKNSEINIENSSPEYVSQRVMEARRLADIVIVSLHQGIEYSKCVDKKSRNLALASVDAGADCVVSHHPHVLQGIEKYKKGIIFHSIGNLLLDIHSVRRPQAAQTVALKIRLSKGGINEILLLPLVLNEAFQPEHPEDKQTEQIISQLNELSNRLKTRLGIFNSYQYANYIWFNSNLKSLRNMMRRVGVINTIRYYLGRVLNKLNINIAMFQ